MKPTKEMIEVMQAALDGKTVQVRKNAASNWMDWFDSPQPVWDWDTQDYRVKPQEPRRIWVTQHSDFPSQLLSAYDAFLESENIRAIKRNGKSMTEFIELTPEIRKTLGLTPS